MGAKILLVVLAKQRYDGETVKGAWLLFYIEPSHIVQGAKILLVVLTTQRHDGVTAKGRG